MGTPKRKEELRPFAVNEMSAALSLVREAAKNFEQREARIAVLEHLRVLLKPLTNWLDVPVNNWYKSTYGVEMTVSSKVHVLPLFGRFDNFLPVGLSRNGSWVAISRDEPGAFITSSEKIVDMVSNARFRILGFLQSVVGPMESAAEIRPVFYHDAFLKYLELGFANLDKILNEREERLRIMRGNLSFIRSFAEGADPLRYGTVSPLSGYAMFSRTDRGTSRYTGTYLTREPVEARVFASNVAGSGSCERFVYEDHLSPPDNLRDFLRYIHTLAQETHEKGQCGRDPLSNEELSLIRDYATNFRTLPDSQ